MNVPISLSVILTDNAATGSPGTVKTGAVTFSGTFYCPLYDPNSVPRLYFGWTQSAESITLGSPGQFHTYTVFAPFQPPITLSEGELRILNVVSTIQVSDYQPGIDPAPGMVAAAPEPSSLVLGFCAAAGILLARRRRCCRAVACGSAP